MENPTAAAPAPAAPTAPILAFNDCEMLIQAMAIYMAFLKKEYPEDAKALAQALRIQEAAAANKFQGLFAAPKEG